MARPRGRQKGRFSRTGPARRARRWNPASGQDAMTRTEMLETMKRLDAHANALLLTGASDIELPGGSFDVTRDFRAWLDAGYGGAMDNTDGRFPGLQCYGVMPSKGAAEIGAGSIGETS